MAISVKDIREKEFSILNTQGYDPDQVDDFLDEVANFVNATVAEDQTLRAKIAQMESEVITLKASLAAAEKAKAEAEARTPDYDEAAYFKDLQNAMHEALTGARRVADEAIAEANRTAAEVKAEADAYAKKATEEADIAAKAAADAAEKKLAELTAESERLETKNKEYRENFRKLVQDQLNFLS